MRDGEIDEGDRVIRLPFCRFGEVIRGYKERFLTGIFNGIY